VRYPLALAVVAAVVAAAWFTGRDRPTPAWITEWLVPILGWVFIGLVTIALVSRLRRGRRDS
jgi:hypothetical protein